MVFLNDFSFLLWPKTVFERAWSRFLALLASVRCNWVVEVTVVMGLKQITWQDEKRSSETKPLAPAFNRATSRFLRLFNINHKN